MNQELSPLSLPLLLFPFFSHLKYQIESINQSKIYSTTISHLPLLQFPLPLNLQSPLFLLILPDHHHEMNEWMVRFFCFFGLPVIIPSQALKEPGLVSQLAIGDPPLQHDGSWFSCHMKGDE